MLDVVFIQDILKGTQVWRFIFRARVISIAVGRHPNPVVVMNRIHVGGSEQNHFVCIRSPPNPTVGSGECHGCKGARTVDPVELGDGVALEGARDVINGRPKFFLALVATLTESFEK